VIKARLNANNLTQVLFNLPTGDWSIGERGIACHPDRVAEFRAGVAQAISYAKVLGNTQINCLAGIRPPMIADKKVKILATLGPAIKGIEDIRQLVEAGANLFRLNFSHGKHAERFNWVREVERQLNQPIGILMDLQGPKLRVGRFAEGKVKLLRGQAFRLDLETTPALWSVPTWRIRRLSTPCSQA
jgi:hypothetical protein